MSFLEKAGNFLQKQMDDVEKRKRKFDRYNDAQLMDRMKHASGKDRIAMMLLAKERGLMSEK